MQEKQTQKQCQNSGCSAVDFLARLSALQDPEKDSEIRAALSSLNWPAWLKPGSLRICCLKMYPACYLMTEGGHLRRSLTRWTDWGMAWNGNASNPKQNEADEADNVNVTVPVNGNVPVTVINNREKADKPPRPRFTPPSEDDAIIYFVEQGSSVAEAKSFIDYYEANGWKVGGRSSMKDWQAAARNWLRRAGQYTRPQTRNAAQESPADTLGRVADRLKAGDFSLLGGTI